jgi:hypothetical protein
MKNNYINMVGQEEQNKFYYGVNMFLFVAWFVLNFLDWVTTQYAPKQMGFIEINPFIHSLILNGWGWLFGVKLALVSLAIFIFFLFYQYGNTTYSGSKLIYHHIITNAGLVIVNVSYFFIVASNLLLIWG